MQKTNHNKSFKIKKLISFNMFRRYLAVFMAILTFITAIPLSNLMTANAGTTVQRTFYFTFDANGSDSYVEDTWVFNDTDLTQVAEDNDEDACWAAWHIATTWSENDYQQSGDISWSGPNFLGQYKADGYFGDATPYIRIRVIPPEGYHLSDITDSNNSNMKYIYDGTYIVADVGVLTGSWVDPSGFSHDDYRTDNSLSNITLYWEADEPTTEMVDVNCYYLNENNEWVYEIANFSHVQVSHNNIDWGRDDNFDVNWNSNYTIYAKPDNGWIIYGWSDAPSKGWEELSGAEIENSNLFHKSSDSSWTGYMDTDEPGIYGTTETISVFIIPGGHILDLNAIY